MTYNAGLGQWRMLIAARLEVRGNDRSTLRSWTRASGIRAGLHSGRGSCCWPGRATRTPRSRSPGRTVAPDGDPLAGSLRGGRAARAAGPGAFRSAAAGRRRAGGGGNVDPAAAVARGDALVEPAAELGLAFATVARIWRKRGSAAPATYLLSRSEQAAVRGDAVVSRKEPRCP